MSLRVEDHVAIGQRGKVGTNQDRTDYRMAKSVNNAIRNLDTTVQSDCSTMMYLLVIDTLSVIFKKGFNIVGFSYFLVDGNGGIKRLLADLEG